MPRGDVALASPFFSPTRERTMLLLVLLFTMLMLVLLMLLVVL